MQLLHKSTGQLLGQKETQEWIKEVTNGKPFYAVTFTPNQTVDYKIQKLGGTLLMNSYDLHQNFENKISQAVNMQKAGVRIPQNTARYIHELSFDKLVEEFGENFVLQTDRAHTGSGTHMVKSPEQFETVSKEYAGNIVKISKYVDGIPITLNVCIYNGNIYIGGLQYQITGIPELASSEGSTVGNDFGWIYQKEISDKLLVDLTTEISKVGKSMIDSGYKGLFGLDLVIMKDEAYLIEINARQSANIPFQTQLELMHLDQPPQLLLHIAEFLGCEPEQFEYSHMPKLQGSQIFLRAKKDIDLKQSVRSGAYRLQSDNSASDWSGDEPERIDNVFFIDEEQDKPLILQNVAYRLDQIGDDSFLMHFQKADNQKRLFDEICRIQFKNSIVDENQNVSPWIIEALLAVERFVI
jgi:predicted ATP-grasp superfamily ATP-dependent carboligase